jgi:hypothetical protein
MDEEEGILKFSEWIEIREEKDASKVRGRYKIYPSAYTSGAMVQGKKGEDEAKKILQDPTWMKRRES